MSVLPDFHHVRPTTVDEALGQLEDPDALPYHGGTELLAVMRIGLLRPRRLVDLKRITELTAIMADGDDVVVGGGATHRQVAADRLVRQRAPLLADVAQRVGNVRVRASGTVAGNLCFAEPKSDLATALLALDAHVVLRSPSGERAMSVDDFLLGAYMTDLQPGELLTQVRVRGDYAQQAVYRKYQTEERPSVGVAVVVSNAANPACRIAVGAVGERPSLFTAADPGAIDPRAIAQQLDVIPDLGGAEDYKRHVSAVTIARAIDDLRGGTT
jgi:carbon-monoxide dehydrogenase medium subunit